MSAGLWAGLRTNAGVRRKAHEARAATHLNERSGERVAFLDGLRGSGVLGVLFMHAFPLALFWNWIWMEMFFVLSGFLITTILLRTDLTQPGALRNFMARRALRIWPVYYAGVFGAFLMWHLYAWWHSIAWQPTWWKLFFYLQFTEGYTELNQSYVLDYVLWFRHSWSLAVEEQYYLFWPLLLLLSRGRPPVLIAMCVTFLLACIWMRTQGHALNILFTRGDGFALGSILALLEDARPRMTAWLRERLLALYAAALVVGVAVIVAYALRGYATDAVNSYQDVTRYGNWTVNVTAAAALFFGLIGLLQNGRLPFLISLFSWRPLTWLGEVSYAVYMFQELVFAGVRHFLHADRLLGVFGAEVLAIAIAIALGPVSRGLLERPINDLKRYFPVITRHGARQEVLSPEPAVEVAPPGPPQGQPARASAWPRPLAT